MDIENIANDIRDITASQIERMEVLKENGYSIDRSCAWEYFRHGLFYENKRLWLIAYTTTTDGIIDSKRFKVYSRRTAIRLWNKLKNSGPHLDIDLSFTPVKPVEYIRVNFKVTKKAGAVFL